MSYPEYRKGDGWRKAGWVLIGAILALAVAACGVGAAAGVYRLVTA
jgi:hypothetical protein